MTIGTLEIEVIVDDKGHRLHVRGFYALETPVTEAELRSLAAHLQRAADEAAKEE